MEARDSHLRRGRSYTEYLKRVRADATIINDSLTAREQDLAAREQQVSAREDAVSKREAKVRSLAADACAAFDAVRKYADAAKEGPLPSPPANDEGDLEIKTAPKERANDQGALPEPENPMLQQPGEPAPLGDDDEPDILQRAPFAIR